MNKISRYLLVYSTLHPIAKHTKQNKSLHICIPCTSHVLVALPSISVAAVLFPRETRYALRQFYMDDADTIVILGPLPGLLQSLRSKSHLTRTTVWEVEMLRAFMNKTYNT